VDGNDTLRFSVNHTTAQRIADLFHAILPTTKISDAIFKRADVSITPCTQTPDAAMANTSRMVRHHREVEKKRAGRTGLVATVGKDWVITNQLEGRPDRAANYGWHDAHAPNGKVWQPLGLAHNRFHVDYSQVVRLVKRTMQVDGADRDIVDVLRDPTLSALVSSEGPIKLWRLAAVPEPGGSSSSPPAPPPPEPPEGSVPRVLRKGMTGADVAAWQAIVGVTADGIFGTDTETATKAWQTAHGLDADGVVGPQTRAKAAEAGGTSPGTAGGGPFPFVQARHYQVANRTKIDLVVIHDMEAPETSVTAENCAAYFAGPNAPVASAHYCIDNDSIVECVKEKDVAFHAPGANHNGVGLEHAGYARQSAEDWADTFSETMLRRSARLAADICARYSIPIEFVDADRLQAGHRGITTHAAVTAAFHQSTHTDPGPSFPMSRYIEMLLEYSS
jgi:peptidoglycan hydrolase-like protein with peptidoglycan-binding domain